jgi:hypothetical protein
MMSAVFWDFKMYEVGMASNSTNFIQNFVNDNLFKIMQSSVAPVRTDVSEELSASVIKVTRNR